ncbi:hypothetical protein F511_22197 [Dorcoceras hygrometricum]|uniref:Uncharacterized protein n=1 Tax=Dorcoceras hygrometricum TaxID=472368 RepID=A0A2Z7CGV6_9LAMI|nr:hypothetical protein F511_22197 [Dorcoceras hygrometricum]
MAHISTVTAMLLAYALAALLATVSAQVEAPAPAPDAGGAVSLTLPAAVVVSSILLSVVALSRH